MEQCGGCFAVFLFKRDADQSRGILSKHYAGRLDPSGELGADSYTSPCLALGLRVECLFGCCQGRVDYEHLVHVGQV
jgi:hypothetical protein